MLDGNLDLTVGTLDSKIWLGLHHPKVSIGIPFSPSNHLYSAIACCQLDAKAYAFVISPQAEVRCATLSSLKTSGILKTSDVDSQVIFGYFIYFFAVTTIRMEKKWVVHFTVFLIG